MESTWFNTKTKQQQSQYSMSQPTWFNTEWPTFQNDNQNHQQSHHQNDNQNHQQSHQQSHNIWGRARSQSPSPPPQNSCSNIIRNTKYNDWCLDEDDCPSPSPLSNHATLFPPPPPPSSFSTTENIARVAPPPTPKPKPKRRPQLLESTSSLPNIPSSNLSFTTPLINSWTVPVTSCHSSFPQYTINMDTTAHNMETTGNEFDTNTDTETIYSSVDKNHITTNELPMEYDVVNEPQYKYNNHKSYLETRKGRNDNMGRFEYITIPDVLEYVTLGGRVCDRYLDEITSYVVRNVNEYELVETEHTTFNGCVYKRMTPGYSYEKYGILAKYCLEWALSNPEKLSMD